jgi:hypothetical protein
VEIVGVLWLDDMQENAREQLCANAAYYTAKTPQFIARAIDDPKNNSLAVPTSN